MAAAFDGHLRFRKRAPCETRHTGPRNASPAHPSGGDYFDILSFDILSLDMWSFDILSSDMLSFFMLVPFDMLSLLMSSANAAGTAKAKASAMATTGKSRR